MYNPQGNNFIAGLALIIGIVFIAIVVLFVASLFGAFGYIIGHGLSSM